MIAFLVALGIRVSGFAERTGHGIRGSGLGTRTDERDRQEISTIAEIY